VGALIAAGGGRPGPAVAVLLPGAVIAALVALGVRLVLRGAELERQLAQRTAVEQELLESRRVLAASEIRYRRLYEGIAAGVLTLEGGGRARSANPALLRMLGHADEDEFLRRSLGDDVWAGPGTLEAVLARVRAEGELVNLEIRLRRRDGRAIVGLATLHAVWGTDGETAAYEVTLVDITDLKLAESQRRSMELRFRRLFDSNAVGVMFGNLQRRTLDDANDYLLGLLGLRRPELPVALASITPDEFLDAQRQVAETLLDSGHVRPFEREWLNRDGERVPVLVSAALVDSARGDFIGVVIDRRAEFAQARRVEESKLFYEFLLDSVPTRIAAVDQDERIRWWNRAYRQWFGDGSEAPGRTIRELVGPARYERVAPQIRRALDGETLRFGTSIERDGQRYQLDITYVPTRDAHGRVTGFLSFVHDVTSHREAVEGWRVPTDGPLEDTIAAGFPDLLSVLRLLETPVRAERHGGGRPDEVSPEDFGKSLAAGARK
jgi:PAS domain S-box-containing protein